ncbi:hypothetical protein LTR16_000044 [Cryomyces antarcticus]|uniref:Uncharacterized protein n=1 Tax=Cryomyces antarcticus TaxID=329879 RepID=A0ABR0M095_9PEZI|nr:hypothetical protein LTR60_002317 [Cryomyces antarcticus]KAK5019920.1 hypothetical protein LTR39_000051 [Cryomyces antarcticus]KAK5257637.1 hypothetical protein LTR16_000044 [Cryomyces antarcticus]
MSESKAPGSVSGLDVWIESMLHETSAKDSALVEALKAPLAQQALVRAWEFLKRNEAVYDLETAHMRLVTVGNLDSTLWVHCCKHNGANHRFRTGISFHRTSSPQMAKDATPSNNAGTMSCGATVEDSAEEPATPAQSGMKDHVTTGAEGAGDTDMADWLVVPDDEDSDWELVEDGA